MPTNIEQFKNWIENGGQLGERERRTGMVPELAAGYGTDRVLVDPSVVPVLDQGYVRFIEAWGTGEAGKRTPIGPEPDYECGIVEAARQSTQGSFRGWDQDAGMLRTLFHHQVNQSTPFEAAGMTIEVQAPVMVFREWHRHRTQGYNEASGRYIQLPDLYYMPQRENVIMRGRAAEKTGNKQAAGTKPFNEAYVDEWLEDVAEVYRLAESVYQAALDNGIPKELARITMPVGHYTRMRATGNLRNWLGFLTLRMDPKAQWEIRQYAYIVAGIVSVYFPRTWTLFNEVLKG